MKAILILLLLTSCSIRPKKDVSPVPYRNVDIRAIEHVQRFEKFYGKKIPNISIEFTDLPKKASGSCTTKSKKIRIDEDYWERQESKYPQEELIFHELAHCVLELGHDNRIEMGTRCPLTMMDEGGAAVRGCYEDFRAYYIREIFFRSKNGKSRSDYRKHRNFEKDRREFPKQKKNK